LSVQGDFRIGKAQIYAKASAAGTAADPQIKIYADGDDTSNSGNPQVSMTMFSSAPSTYGGTLHGTWVSSSVLTSSDRRMKYDVVPLFKTIMHQHNANNKIAATSNVHFGDQHDESNSFSMENVMSSIIKQIRPVSFRYKKHTDSKYNRYGFIAQELEAVLPSVIMTDKSSGMKAVNYNDMIAVLALGLQSVDQRVQDIQDKVTQIASKQDNYYVDLTDRMQLIETMVTRVLKANVLDAPADLRITNDTTTMSHSVDGIGVEDPRIQQSEEASKRKEKIIQLLGKLDFQSDIWKNLSQARKDKLREKLSSYGIDLDTVIARVELGISIEKQLQSNSTIQGDVSISDSSLDGDAGIAYLGDIDQIELNTITDSVKDQVSHKTSLRHKTVDEDSEDIYA
jgi:hypothetical protein